VTWNRSSLQPCFLFFHKSSSWLTRTDDLLRSTVKYFLKLVLMAPPLFPLRSSEYCDTFPNILAKAAIGHNQTNQTETQCHFNVRYLLFGEPWCFLLQGEILLQNIAILLQPYKASQSRRPWHESSPPWKSQISHQTSKGSYFVPNYRQGRYRTSLCVGTVTWRWKWHLWLRYYYWNSSHIFMRSLTFFSYSCRRQHNSKMKAQKLV
jgi:hypothetical protein